jgi:mutator protein MutT
MDEKWDLFDKNRNKLNRVATRGEKLKFGEYHLVVNAWIKNDKDEFLITRRSENKKHPLMWECTGGSVLMGETSKEAAIREVKEELGIDVKDGILIGSTIRYYPNRPDILDVWLFKSNCKIEDVQIQEDEVCEVMLASSDKIKEIYNEGNFEANPFIEDAIK